MAEIIFIVMAVAAIVLMGIAWTFARSRSRRGLSWTAPATRHTMPPIPINLGKRLRRYRSATSDR